jgi:hypothetical protein
VFTARCELNLEIYLKLVLVLKGGRVGAVGYYKSEVLGFDSVWCHWNFSLIYIYTPSGRSSALVLTHPLTEMSTRNISWG